MKTMMQNDIEVLSTTKTYSVPEDLDYTDVEIKIAQEINLKDNQNLLSQEKGRKRSYTMYKTTREEAFTGMLVHKANQVTCYTELLAQFKEFGVC